MKNHIVGAACAIFAVFVFWYGGVDFFVRSFTNAILLLLVAIAYGVGYYYPKEGK